MGPTMISSDNICMHGHRGMLTIRTAMKTYTEHCTLSEEPADWTGSFRLTLPFKPVDHKQLTNMLRRYNFTIKEVSFSVPRLTVAKAHDHGVPMRCETPYIFLISPLLLYKHTSNKI